MLKHLCLGTISSRVHASHSLFCTADVFWCAKCGAYARRVPRRLRRICPGQPRTEADRHRLCRMREGHVPATRSEIGIRRRKPSQRPRVCGGHGPGHGSCCSGDRLAEQEGAARRPRCQLGSNSMAGWVARVASDDAGGSATPISSSSSSTVAASCVSRVRDDRAHPSTPKASASGEADLMAELMDLERCGLRVAWR